MTFAFGHRSHIERQVRQIAGQQISRAMDDVSGAEADFDGTVHGLRRRCKKLRGLVQLIRPRFRQWKRNDRLFRDAARRLSGSRDAAVLVETFDDVVNGEDEIGLLQAEEIRQWLQGRVVEPLDAGQRASFFGDFVDLFEEARRSASRWSLAGNGFAQIGDGLEQGYRRMRQGMELARRSGNPDALHAWRKETKYHWHHVSLLQATAPDVLGPRRKALAGLGDLLGDHHNLTVLAETLETSPYGDVATAPIARRQASLAGDAFALGRQLAAEKPRALRERFEKYWSLLPEKD